MAERDSHRARLLAAVKAGPLEDKSVGAQSRDTPTHAELAAILEGKPNMDALSEIDLIELGKRHRLQTVVFKMARDVFDQMQPSWKGNRDSLLSGYSPCSAGA